jgi:acyl-CoA thioester hydrolase
MTADAPTAGRFEGRAHRLPVRVYYEDTDFTGVVYHANYLRFFERGRSDFVRSIGVAHQALLAEPEPIAFSVAAIAVRFLKPARVDDALTVETLFNTVKGPRLLIAQTLWRGPEALCTAEVEACCIDLTGRPRKPPLALRQALGPYLEPQ